MGYSDLAGIQVYESFRLVGPSDLGDYSGLGGHSDLGAHSDLVKAWKFFSIYTFYHLNDFKLKITVS